MKLIAVLCVVLQIILSLLGYAAFYWLGYSETSAAFTATDPLSLLLIYVTLFLILLSIWIRSLALIKNRLWMTLALITYVAYFMVPLTALPAHGPLIVYGLRDRMIRDYGLDDMRHFARDVGQVLHDGYLDHGGEGVLYAEQRAEYDKLKEKYPYLSWKGGGSFGPSINIRDGTVNTDWGGPFGHWGFSIAIEGGQNVPPNDPEYFILPASNDIYFYMD